MTTACVEAASVVPLSRGGHRARLADGRVHLQHGPIDLVIELAGSSRAQAAAAHRATARFDGLLSGLVQHLPSLRRPAPSPGWAESNDAPRDRASPPPGASRQRKATAGDAVAVRMHAATDRFAADVPFVTPMAAVAGAVADEVLDAVVGVPDLARASVNNGGDIALWLAPGQSYRIGLCVDVARGTVSGELLVSSAGRHGVATSGWAGRSHSLGVADAVTVLADSAARADAAATLIANAVDVRGSAQVRRCPALELDPDSDLGTTPVTVAVGQLDAVTRQRALADGLALAMRWWRAGVVQAASLHVQGDTVSTPVSRSRLDGPRVIRQHPVSEAR